MVNKLVFVCLVTLVFLTACSPSQPTVAPAVKETVSTELTRMAQENQGGIIATQDIPGTPTPNNPVDTPVPTETLAPTAAPTASPTSLPCNQAMYLQDITYPEGSNVIPGGAFTKTWQVKNTGTCSWTTSYSIIYAGGDQMGGPPAAALTRQINPGETGYITVPLRAPGQEGSYNSYWQLQSDRGERFGTGSAQTSLPLAVKVYVSGYHTDPVPASMFLFDFSSQVCNARWRSSAEFATTPCSGAVTYPAWVALFGQPYIPDANQPGWALVTRPPGGSGSWIEGIYPPYTVQEGDRFEAMLGCLDESARCTVTFSLSFEESGQVYNIKNWKTQTGRGRFIDDSLDVLVGKRVRFILNLTNNGASQVDAFWYAAGIRNP